MTLLNSALSDLRLIRRNPVFHASQPFLSDLFSFALDSFFGSEKNILMTMGLKNKT